MKTAMVMVGNEVKSVSAAEWVAFEAANPGMVVIADALKSVVKNFGPVLSDEELKAVLAANERYTARSGEINTTANAEIEAINNKRDEDLKKAKEAAAAELLTIIEARKAAELEKYNTAETVEVNGNNCFIGYVKKDGAVKKVYITGVDLMAKKVSSMLVKENYDGSERTRFYNADEVINYKAIVGALVA